MQTMLQSVQTPRGVVGPPRRAAKGGGQDSGGVGGPASDRRVAQPLWSGSCCGLFSSGQGVGIT